MSRPYYPPQGGLQGWIPPQGSKGKARIEVTITPSEVTEFVLGTGKLDKDPLA